MKRLQDASCAICMDSLFDLRDDLDEVLPIATPDCGHVFHERCLLEWFQSQADQYLARELEYRGVQLTLADAPAECPQCRTECFADPETGKPAIHRLFINWGEEEALSSQIAGSSPLRPTQKSWKRPADQELLNLARRARNISAEVDSYTAESAEGDIAGTLRRAESLRADAVETRAAKGFKSYIGGLTRALNELSERLQTHPLVGTLQTRLAQAEQLIRERDAELVRWQQVELPRAVKSAVRAETARMERKVAHADSQRELMQLELQKEQVARRNQRRAAAEREEELEARLKAHADKIEAIQADADEMRARLDERNKQVQLLRSRLDSRKELKRRIAELEAENESLKRGAAAAADPNTEAADTAGRDAGEEDDRGSPFPFASSPELGPAPEEESLLIDMPSMLPDSSPPQPRRSTTARTFSYGPSGRPSKSSKPSKLSRSSSRSSKTKSKYFSTPSPSKSRDATDTTPSPRRVLVAASSPSPLRPAHAVPRPPMERVRSHTNPFKLPQSRKRSPSPEREVIVLDDTPPRPPKKPAPAPGIMDLLADRNGRPRKGVAIGPKYRRRAA